MLYANDQELLAISEESLQLSLHNFNTITQSYGMEVSNEKTKVLAFRGKGSK